MSIEETARRAHESQHDAVLRELQHGPVYRVSWESRHRGARLAPAIEILRNRLGYVIEGTGRTTPDDPYRLAGRRPQGPPVAPTFRPASTEPKQAVVVLSRNVATLARTVASADDDGRPIQYPATVWQNGHANVFHPKTRQLLVSGLSGDQFQIIAETERPR